jgi:hypothetical protein
METLTNRINTVLLAMLLLCATAGSPAVAVTSEEIETSIEAGINWLAAQQAPDGSWVSWVEDGDYPSSISPTAFAVIKLGEYARELGYDSPFDPCYPYNEAVEKGLEYIFSHAHIINISPQPAGNPDGDGDGNGVHFGDDIYHWEETYNTGIVMMAIGATRSPDRIVAAPGSPIDGWTYKQVLDDVVDYMAFGQTDEPSGRGGWGYYPNGGDWSEDPCDITTTYSDNSNTGFVVLGLAYAESKAYGFNCVIPQFVRNELNIWINHIQAEGGPFDGGSGYEDPNEMVNALKTGNLVFEMAFYGDGPGVPRMQRALDYLARMWNHPTGNPGWKGPPPQYQAIYCLMKGLEYRGIAGILAYPVAQNVVYDVDMFEVTGLGTGPVDIEVVSGYLDTILGLFDSNGTLITTDDDGGVDELSRLAGITPESGKVRLAIAGCPDFSFDGSHMEMGEYKVAVWPSGSAAPNEPVVDESESNDDFSDRNVFSSSGQLVINAALGISEYFPPEGEPAVIDWYDDLANVILATQNPDGSWPDDAWGSSGDSVLTTAWALLTLEKVTPPVAEIYGQCILAGESFEPVNLDEGIDPENPGTPPYTWTVMGNVDLMIDVNSGNVMMVTYPNGWTGSETLTLICVDAANQTYIIPYPNPTYTVCAQPVVLDIPDQTAPFEPFDLDDYLDPMCGLNSNEVDWSYYAVPEGWSVAIDVNNVVTVTAPSGVSGSAAITFTATSNVCLCLDPVPSDDDDATFTAADAQQIEVDINLDPDTLNLKSKGNWITCYISLPAGYNVADIEPGSIMLEGQIAAEQKWFEQKNQILIVKFSRSTVKDILTVGDVELAVTGEFADGTVFAGVDTIRVTE